MLMLMGFVFLDLSADAKLWRMRHKFKGF